MGGAFLKLAKLNPYGVIVVICCDVGRCDMARATPPKVANDQSCSMDVTVVRM